jgi:hypothetical protein
MRPLQGRVLVNVAGAGAMHIDTTSFPAVVLINLDAGRSKAGAYIPGI